MRPGGPRWTARSQGPALAPTALQRPAGAAVMPRVQEGEKGAAWEFLRGGCTMTPCCVPTGGTVLDTQQGPKKQLLRERTNGEKREKGQMEERARLQ